MPRMRKTWLRTAETPKELRLSLDRSSHRRRPHTPVDGGGSDDASEPVSHLRSLDAIGVDMDGVEQVDQETLQRLEATFLRGLGEAEHSASNWELSFRNDVDNGLASAAGSTEARTRQSNTENIPPLNVPKKSRTRVKRTTESTTAQSRLGPTKADMHDLQPFLGAQLKRNLGKMGLEKQHLSLKADEWDDDESINMLGTNFGSKEEERLAKHEQWFNKNLGPAFIKKRSEALLRESENKLPEQQVMKRLSSHGRVSLIVANQDDWRTSQTRSLLSKSSSQLLYADPGDDICIADLMRSRAHEQKAGTRRGAPWPRHESLRSSSQSRSGSCPPLLAPNSRDRLRQSTRFLDSRGQICKNSASKVFSQEFSQESVHSWSRLAADAPTESLNSSVHSHSYRSSAKHASSHAHAAASSLVEPSSSKRPSSVVVPSRPQTPEEETKHFVSQHTVYPGLYGAQKHSAQTVDMGKPDGMQRGKQIGRPSHLIVDEVSSWNVYSPGREELTPLDTLIQEKEGHYIRSPTRNFDIHEADLLREMRAKNITLSPATRILRERPGVDAMGNVNAIAGQPDLAKDIANGDNKTFHRNAGPAHVDLNLPSPDLLEQSPGSQSPFTKLRMESVLNKALNEHPAFADSLPIVEDDAVGNCF